MSTVQSCYISINEQLTVEEIERLACMLLTIKQPAFHGSKTIHYADGKPMKLVDTVTRAI